MHLRPFNPPRIHNAERVLLRVLLLSPPLPLFHPEGKRKGGKEDKSARAGIPLTHRPDIDPAGPERYSCRLEEIGWRFVMKFRSFSIWQYSFPISFFSLYRNSYGTIDQRFFNKYLNIYMYIYGW